MPRCYWFQCSCPDTQPCPEHTGVGCSLLGGVLVTSPQGVNDAVTHDADLAVVSMAADSTRLDELHARLETRLQDLERQKREIEDAAATAGGFFERRAVVDRAQRLHDSLLHVDDELRQVVNDLDVLDRTWQWQANAVGILLNRPYFDPAGYCSCYGRKVQRLSTLDAMLAGEQTRINQLMGELNYWQAQLTPGFTNFTQAKAMIALFGLLMFSLGVLGWVLFGTANAAALGALIGLVIFAIALYALVIHVVAVRAALVASRRRLLTLYLLYYRIQQIPTCQHPPLTAGGDSWWEWLLDQLKDVPGLPVPRLPPGPPREPAY